MLNTIFEKIIKYFSKNPQYTKDIDVLYACAKIEVNRLNSFLEMVYSVLKSIVLRKIDLRFDCIFRGDKTQTSWYYVL